MAKKKNILTLWLQEVLLAFSVILKINSPEALQLLLKRLGYEVPLTELAEVEFPKFDKVEEGKKIAEQLKAQGESPDWKEVLLLLSFLNTVGPELVRLSSSLKKINSLSKSSFAGELLPRLVDYLLLSHLYVNSPRSYGLLQFIGLMERTWREADPEIAQPAFLYHKIYWSRIPLLLQPAQLFEESYGWKTDFQGQEFLDRLQEFMALWYLPGGLYPLRPSLREFARGEKEMRVPLILKNTNSKSVYFGFSLFESDPQQQMGLGLRPFSSGEVEIDFDISSSWRGNLRLDSEQELPGVRISPPFRIDQLPVPGVGQDFEGVISIQPTSEEVFPIFLLGSEKGTHLQITRLHADLSVALNKDGQDLSFGLFVDEGKLVINPAQGDGLAQEGVKQPFEVPFELGFLLDGSGVSLMGGAGLDRSFPLGKQIGPLTLHRLHLSLFIGDEAVEISSLVDLNIGLGFLDLALIEIGVAFRGAFEQFGKFETDATDLSFVSPSGLGLSLRSEVISGGGFLMVKKSKKNKEKKDYLGGLSLQLKKLELSAVGILTTHLPNGRRGFALLLSIRVPFVPPVQLGFGFYLNAVGGMLALNRGLNLGELERRMHSGAIESLLIPENPVENLPRVISDLDAVLPVREGRFAIAPMFEINWGLPALITGKLGLFVELPFRGRLLILGSMEISLPAEKFPIVNMKVEVLGAFDLARKKMLIQGHIREAKVAMFELEGGFAFMVSWGRRPAFLFSIGGYHPRYKQPAAFPDIPRLSMSIRKAVGPARLSMGCQYYQAISSNSFQIGFRADAELRTGSFNVKAHYSFNTLLQFNPLLFDVDFRLSVHIRYKSHKLAGISLYLNLRGPSRWLVVGRAEIKLLVVKAKFRLRASWGEKDRQPRTYIETSELLDQLKQELQTPANWSAMLPDHFQPAEALQPAEREEGLILHPSGYLELRQNALPLNTRLEKVSKAYLREETRFRIRDLQVGDGEGADIHEDNQKLIREHFAVGQYRELSEEAQLSRPDFSRMGAGLRFGERGDIDMPFGADDFVADSGAFDYTILNREGQPQQVEASNKPDAAEMQAALKKSLRRKEDENRPYKKFKMLHFHPLVHAYLMAKQQQKKSS